MDLLPVIRKLLFREEGLIIPGLGGFISQYRPAEIHAESGTFVPPAKEVVFNPEVRQDDGMLAGHVARMTGISTEDALAGIGKFVDELLKRLHKGDRVFLEGIGFFYLDAQGNAKFQVEAGTNLLLDSFGFVPFYLKEIHNENDTILKTSPIFRQAEALAPAALPGTTLPVEKSRTVRRLLVAIPLLLIFMLMPYNSKVTRILIKNRTILAPEPSLFRLDYPDPVPADTARIIEYPIGDTL
jgi:hypothetical protein